MPTPSNFGRADDPAPGQPRRSSFRSSVLGGAVAVALSLLLLVAFIAGGCGRSEPEKPNRPDRQRQSQHADFLPTIMNMARPERLGLDTSAEQVARFLNRWRDMQDAELSESAGLSAAAEQLVKEQLPPGTLEAIRRERFDERDAEHVRTARMMRQIVDHVVRSEPDPALRAVAVFDYVTRNVELVAADAIPPLTPFEVLLYGRGTVADRAWVFAELLRQLQIDAVILTPTEATAKETADGSTAKSLLVGVLIGDEVLLFDPQLGAAVPSQKADEDDAGETASDELLPTRPATLADFSAKQSAQWRPAVVGTAVLWSPRMGLLQGALRGDEIGAVVHQSLSADEAAGSVLDRVRAAGGSVWSADDVTLWTYPQQQINRRESGDVLVYERLHEPMRMPRTFDTVEPPEQSQGRQSTERFAVLGDPTWALWKQRIDHLLGRSGIPGYHQVQDAANEIRKFRNVSLDVVQTHEDAAEDAMFWIGVAQMAGLTDDVRRYSLAAEHFAYYIDQHAQRGRHTNQARLLLARVLAEQGEMQAALAALREVPESAPLHAAAQFRLHRWSAEEPTDTPTVTNAKPAIAEKAM